MSPPTQPSPPSSGASAPAIVLRPEPSRLLAAWWVAVHALAIAALPLIGWPAGCALAAAAAVLAHAVVRRPQSAPLLLIIYRDGQVDWPEAGWAGLEIADGTRFTALWALLLLRPPAGGSDLRVLLIADQLDMVTWRTLLARLGQAHAVGRSRRAEHDSRPDLR